MTRTAPPTAPPEAPQSTFTLAPAYVPNPASPVASWPSPLTLQPLPETVLSKNDETGKTRRSNRGRGMPVGPVLAAGGNATALTLTTAYQYGGPVAAATTGVVMAAGATAVMLRRRATVRRTMASRSGPGGALRGGHNLNRRGGSGSGSGGALGAGSGRSGGVSRSATGGGRGAAGGATNTRLRGATGPGTGRSGALPKAPGTHSASGRHGATSPLHKNRGAGNRGAGADLLRPNKTPLRGTTGAGIPSSAGGRHKTGPTHTPATGRGGRHAAANRAATNARTGTVKAALGRATRAAGVGARAAGSLAARAAGAGWKMTAPARAAGRKKLAAVTKAATAGLARQIKKVPGALADGLLATGAGVLSGLWNRSGKAALARLRDVWKRRRARRAKNADSTPDTTDPSSSTPDAPDIACTVRRPAHAPATTTSFGGTMSGGHHFVAPAMEMARIAANYNPTGMLQVGEDFVGLSEAIQLHAEAMKVTVENADAQWPLDPNIIEIMRQVHSLQLKAADLAQELKPAFEQLHQVDLDRLRNPRKGTSAEAMWDVSSNM